ncbi:hypothetical protein MVEN_01634800 [Mycena venus]|uniref:Uncharacterized protein n=1 Tax=Mycena venus TaxID=2733690 RepID=A0A8H7CQQ2_9AGAR|nr:hypothetical protein MVEN_01634800 [Mycena venus]
MLWVLKIFFHTPIPTLGIINDLLRRRQRSLHPNCSSTCRHGVSEGRQQGANNLYNFEGFGRTSSESPSHKSPFLFSWHRRPFKLSPSFAMFGTTIFIASTSIFLSLVPVSMAHPAKFVARFLEQADILQRPLDVEGIIPSCSTQCNLLHNSLQSNIFVNTLCTSFVLTQANFCYSCMVTSGIPVGPLQDQANLFVSSCNSANTGGIPLQDTTIIDASSTTEDGGDKGGNEDVNPDSEGSNDAGGATSGSSGATSSSSGATSGSSGATGSSSAPGASNSAPADKKPNSGVKAVARVGNEMIVLGVSGLAAAFLVGL